MGDALRNRIKQDRFETPAQEALLNVLVAADYLHRRFERVCAEFGITHTQYNVLRILRGVYPEGHPRCDIAARMLERAPDVTRLVDRLEGQGLVDRARSVEDRRQSVTRITEKGLELLARIDPALRACHRELSRRLPRRDCLELSRICEAIYSDEE